VRPDAFEPTELCDGVPADRAGNLAGHSPRAALAAFAVSGVLVLGCRDADADAFATRDGRFEGEVVAGAFVRAGIEPKTRLCLAFDPSRLQSTPGTLSTSDGRFVRARLRAIPQLWHDPLSMIAFGQGRSQNLLYVARTEPQPNAPAVEANVVVSLMQDGTVEVRIFYGAPSEAAPSADGAAETPEPVGAPGGTATAPPLFGVFALQREEGPCSF
jgi:hypothetical protein